MKLSCVGCVPDVSS